MTARVTRLLALLVCLVAIADEADDAASRFAAKLAAEGRVEVVHESARPWFIEVSRDRRWMVTNAGENGVSVWDVARMRRVATIGGGRAIGVAISPKSDCLVAVHRTEMVVWTVPDGVLKCRIPLGEAAVIFDASGTRLFGKTHATVTAWDPDAGRRLGSSQLRWARPHVWQEPRCRDLGWSVDGRLIAASGPDLFAIDPVTLAVEVLVANASVLRFAVSSDGKALAYRTDEHAIVLADLPEGATRRKLVGHSDGHSQLEFSPDRKLLASTSGASVGLGTRVWDVESGRPMWLLHPGTGGAPSRFSADGALLATCGPEDQLVFWSVERLLKGEGVEHAARCRSGHHAAVSALAFTRDSRRLLSASDDTTVRAWNVSTAECVATLSAHGSGVRHLSVAIDGSTFATTDVRGEGRIWDSTTLTELARFDKGESFLWAISSGRYWVGGEDESRFVDGRTGQPSKSFDLGDDLDRRRPCGVSPDGRHYVPERWSLVVARVEDAKRVFAVERSATVFPEAIAFSPDGARMFVVERWSSAISAIGVPAGTNLWTRVLTARVVPITLAVDPDGTCVATWDGTSIVLLRAADGEVVRTIATDAGRDHGGPIAFSLDGRTLAAAWRSTIALYDVATGARRHIIESDADPPR